MLRTLRDLAVIAFGVVSLLVFFSAPIVMVVLWLALARLSHNYP